MTETFNNHQKTTPDNMELDDIELNKNDGLYSYPWGVCGESLLGGSFDDTCESSQDFVTCNDVWMEYIPDTTTTPTGPAKFMVTPPIYTINMETPSFQTLQQHGNNKGTMQENLEYDTSDKKQQEQTQVFKRHTAGVPML